MPTPAHPSIHVLDKAWEEIPEERRGVFLGRIVDGFARELARTAGSRVKRLRGPYDGLAYRVRWGELRAPVSFLPDWKGRPHLFVHQCAGRDEIYDSEQFRVRLDRFHKELWDNAAGRFRVDPGRAGYRVVEDVVALEGDELRVELLPSEAQMALLREMLPFPGFGEAGHAAVVLGHGPPGSGKTVLVQEAARVAAEGDSSEPSPYQVLILVPSARLVQRYGAELTALGVGFGGMEQALAGKPEPVTLAQSERFFAAFAGVTGSPSERQEKLVAWWGDLLQRPMLRPWLLEHPVVQSTRFLDLVDAALEDPGALLEEDRKDALDAQDRPLYALVRQFQSRPKWMELARKQRAKAGLALRSELAPRALAALTAAGGDPWNGRLLVLVDEAQDLVPGEWGAAIEWVVGTTERRNGGTMARLALFGDENQRISPTAFSWNDVRARCEALGLDRRLVASVELPGSFRLTRRVAEIAGELFHAEICERGKLREVARADPERLAPGGEVEVVVMREPGIMTLGGIAALVEVRSPGSSLMVLVHEEDLLPAGQTVKERDIKVTSAEPEPGEQPDADDWLDLVEPRQVKGLEFARLAVVAPFHRKGERLSYDGATVAYTALTRATDRLLVALSPEEWGLVEGRWRALGVEPVFLQNNAEDRRRLAELLAGVMGEVDLEERVAVQLARIREELARMPVGGGSKTEGTGRLRRIAAPAAGLLQLGRAVELDQEFGGVLARYPWLRLAAEGLIAKGTEEPGTAVALLILLGEYGRAFRVANRYGGVMGDLRQIERLVCAAGVWEQAIALGSEMLHARPEVPSGLVLAYLLAYVSFHKAMGHPLPPLEG